MKTNSQSLRNDLVEAEISYSPIDSDLNREAEERLHRDIHVFLGKLFNLLDVEKAAKKVVNPDQEYAVKFTPELLRKMEEHDMQFLRDKITGDLLPDLYDYTEKGIGGKIRLEIKGNPTGQDLANLRLSVNNLIEQQRYNALIEEVHQIQIIANRLERGQDNDRFAKVDAGRKHLIDALHYRGPESERRMMILNAVALLREGRELIEKTLLDKMNALKPVPDNSFLLLCKCFFYPSYYSDNVGRYDDIQEYFQYYCMSIQPMAYAYTVLGQPHLITELIEDSKKVFEHENILHLSSIEHLLPNREFGEMWYQSPEKIEKKLLESYKDVTNEDRYITVKGSEILEVIENG